MAGKRYIDIVDKIKRCLLRPGPLICLFLALAIFATFFQLTNHDFVYIDDPVYVTKNFHVQAGLTAEGIEWAFTTTYAEFWHPLTWLSHMLDCQLYGLSPGMHHFTSLIFHIVNSLFLFLVCRRMTGALWRSAFVAAMFGLHPLHVESVAWIAERKDVLSTFFWLLTMWAYIRFTERPSPPRYSLVLLFFVLGLMAKPMLVTLPFVLLLLDYWPLARFSFSRSRNGKPRQRWVHLYLIWEKLPLFALSVAASVLTFHVQKSRGALSSLNLVPLGMRISNALISYVDYITKTIWPHHLAVFYPFPTILAGWMVAGACLILVSISLLVITIAKSRPYLIVGWLWYIGTLVPVIGLVKFGAHAMADRFTYVPLIGIFIIIAWAAPELAARWRYKKIGLASMAGASVLVLMTSSWLQAGFWANNITLFRHALDVTTNNYIAQNNLGLALAKHGKAKAAISHYMAALRIRPNYIKAHNNLGNVFASQGRIDEAMDQYHEVLRINPFDAKAHNNLGNTLLGTGRIDEAIRHYSEALRLDPDNAKIHTNLGSALVRVGKIDQAIFHFREALRIRPAFAPAYYKLKRALDDTAAEKKQYQPGR